MYTSSQSPSKSRPLKKFYFKSIYLLKTVRVIYHADLFITGMKAIYLIRIIAGFEHTKFQNYFF